jgi:hypothetical protein
MRGDIGREIARAIQRAARDIGSGKQCRSGIGPNQPPTQEHRDQNRNNKRFLHNPQIYGLRAVFTVGSVQSVR